MRTGGAAGRVPVLGPALLIGALLTGCGGSGAPDGAGDGPGATEAGHRGPRAPHASPAAPPPEDLCARLVAHWSRKVLAGETYGDYQSMGLSNGQYEIARDIVDAARAEKKRQGAQAAERLVDRTARERCEERYRDGGPSGGPWS